MQKAMSDFTTILQETISGIRVIKAFTSEKIILNKFEDQTKSYVKSAIKLNKINALVPAVNEIMAISALSIVLVVGGLGVVVYKNIQPDDLMTFLFSLFAIMTPITLVVNNINNFQRGIVSGERIFEILDADEKIISGKLLKVKFEKEIKFQNINFAYNVVNILKNINFEIFKGQRIALVGSSGSGKSTILDLLIRFYDTSSGELIVDGVNIKEYDLVSYRNLFGIVSQENLLFNDTIGNNINFGNNDLSNEEMINICKLANCYNFINKLDNKFETIVGDKGVNLSGGERQRIAIARALAKNPEIIVFDEATSALDAESEKLVQEAMNHILDTRTSIVVAHRLSTIINSDVIFVFENGEIVEFGSHLELIKNNGVYKKLYEIQNINPN
jgi:subfamily B ATP-binding cassette protein MsbA